MHVICRDLKTANILMNKTGEVKLGDFGIARVMSGESDMAKTMIGTPYYRERLFCNESDSHTCIIVIAFAPRLLFLALMETADGYKNANLWYIGAYIHGMYAYAHVNTYYKCIDESHV